MASMSVMPDWCHTSSTACNHLITQLNVPCDKKPAVMHPKGWPLWDVLLRKQEPLMLFLSSTKDDNGNLCASAYLSPPQMAIRHDPKNRTSFRDADFCKSLLSNWTTAHSGNGAVSCWSLGLFVLRNESTKGSRKTLNDNTDMTFAHHLMDLMIFFPPTDDSSEDLFKLDCKRRSASSIGRKLCHCNLNSEQSFKKCRMPAVYFRTVDGANSSKTRCKWMSGCLDSVNARANPDLSPNWLKILLNCCTIKGLSDGCFDLSIAALFIWLPNFGKFADWLWCVFALFSTLDSVTTSEDDPRWTGSDAALGSKRRLFGVVSARDGRGRGSSWGNICKLFGTTSKGVPKEGAGNPGVRSDNEKCTSAVGTLTKGDLGFDGCALADACPKGDDLILLWIEETLKLLSTKDVSSARTGPNPLANSHSRRLSESVTCSQLESIRMTPGHHARDRPENAKSKKQNLKQHDWDVKWKRIANRMCYL